MSALPAGPRKVLRWFRKRLLPPPPPVVTPEILARNLVAQGDLARSREDWSGAAAAYTAALVHQPGQAAILVQLGHMLKEDGRLGDAEAAYGAAAEAAPLEAEPWLQRAHVLKALGRGQAAIEAFVEALRRDPRARGARDELIAVGARDRLPRPAFGPGVASADLAEISRSLGSTLTALHDWVQVSTYPLDAWHDFRRAYPVAPPPPGGRGGPVVVVVDAAGAAPAALIRTLDSLMDQKHRDWTALVRAGAALRDHPVASFEAVDPRVIFISDREAVGDRLKAQADAHILALSAGVVLDPEALAWFLAAAGRTGAQAVYADHDHHEDDWRRGPVYREPALQSMPDIDDLSTVPRPPAAVLLAPGQAGVLALALANGTGSAALGRALIIDVAAASGRVAHLPRLLSSVWTGSAADEVSEPLPLPPARDSNDRILVVIPTRDQAGLLGACVDSLCTFADRPDTIDVLILDNRSTEVASRRLLGELATRPGIEVESMDAPFNWSRFNNLATRGRNQPLIVFANNDVEAVSGGWDSIVRRELSDPHVGVVGARLMYGDATLQHGGVVLGAADGRPLHEGLGAAALDPGPMWRYRRTRPVAAVTGAFMAVRRETFEALGGFDERLAVGYNDIDFCLKVRENRLMVRYVPDLDLIHRESRTRGFNDSVEKVDWDDTELRRLYDRWGTGVFQDPGVNPHWGSGPGRPLDGYRDPTLTQVLSWLDRSALPGPWFAVKARRPEGNEASGLTVAASRTS